jgi:RNA polymerase sigma-70 factor (ECF subfamily)
MSGNSDKKLICLYLNGDEKALEILIARYLKPIYSFAYHNVGNIADAEDITQEVFVKVWKNIKKHDSKKGSFKSWIFTIAKNTSIDFLRKKKSIPFSMFENQGEQNAFIERLVVPEISLCDTFDNRKTLEPAIENLPPKYRIVFNYRHNDNLRFSEISQALGESINTVKSRYRRALISIRKFIKS